MRSFTIGFLTRLGTAAAAATSLALALSSILDSRPHDMEEMALKSYIDDRPMDGRQSGSVS